MSGFMVDVVTDEEDDFLESICAICDNGGYLLCCGGKCLRSFHATEEAGSDSACESLGFSNEQDRSLLRFRFECKNCQYKQHQCYICGELGSSDKSVGAEVFQCASGTCRYFYHPQCVAQWFQFKIGEQAECLAEEIAVGKPFICPHHVCYACKRLETKRTDDLQLQFAVCRRCPRAYHQKCLPKNITFEGTEDEPLPRAWEGLLPRKILMYCGDHEILEELGSPIRNHIRFPN